MSLNNAIDLRSDTLTIPTPAMREAMAAAEVGDDVFGEDPTVNALQEVAATKLGHQAGLLVSSGTMGNLAAMLAHCRRGDEIICGEQSHIYYYEQGGMAALGGIIPRTLPNQPDGTLRIEDIAHSMRGDDQHFATTRLVALENTQNRMGGAVLPLAYIQQVAELAHSRGLRLHMDGARVFNAAAALNIPVGEITQYADSVTFCLSKGLSAPVGSVLVGSKEFIHKAFRARKALGGGMRQAGVIAAAGLVALEHMTERLRDDHANAKLLAEGINQVPGLQTINVPQTNIVYFDVAPSVPFDAAELCKRALKHRVKMLPTGARRIRAVTHAWVSRDEIVEAIQVISHAMNETFVANGKEVKVGSY
jgi:threonine aldolase